MQIYKIFFLEGHYFLDIQYVRISNWDTSISLALVVVSRNHKASHIKHHYAASAPGFNMVSKI